MFEKQNLPQKIKLKITNGRFYIDAPDENAEVIENILSHLFGISGWAKTETCEKSLEKILELSIKEGKKLEKLGLKTFKIEARRTDKSFPLNSYELCCRAGEAVLNTIDGLKVDVNNPDQIIYIEVREKAFVYSNGKKGLGGLPVGSGGKGLLLLSGGIDSPVAGVLMAGRGMSINAVHFHSYPYTSIEAKEKVIKLAQIAGSYCLGLSLYILNFTQVQMRIKERAPVPWTTVLLRMAMMEAAEIIAHKSKCKCLVTGESLSQVASQTIENLTCTESRVKLPVLRPLIGLNKETITLEAKRIGTFETSIQPYEDCCMLFSPAHPVLRGDAAEAGSLYEKLEIESLIEEAVKTCEIIEPEINNSPSTS